MDFSVHFLSFPSRVFCVKMKRRKKASAENCYLFISKQSACCPHILLFFPKGKNKSFGGKPKTFGAGKTSKSPFSQRSSLTKALPPGEISQRPRLTSHPDGQLQEPVKESLAEICSSCSSLKLQQKRRQERAFHSLGFWCIE